LTVLASLGFQAGARAQQQELVVHADRSHPFMEELWPVIRDYRATLPPFLRDTALTLLLRNYYESVVPVTGTNRGAWAFGGWLAYQSGWLLNAFQIGATYYAAGPVFPPLNKGETMLLATGQSGYEVFGEAFAALRYESYALLKGYRQEVKQPYLNRLDNRMTPHTFEGVTLGGLVGPVEYAAGYFTKIKLRSADQFVPMSEAAGALGSNYGTALVSVKFRPLSQLSVQVDDIYGVNTFNTLFAQAEHVWPLAHDARLQFGAQFTDQRAVGKALAFRTNVTHWQTRSGSARLALTWRELTLKAAGSVTTSGNKIRAPWGAYPGYLFLAAQQYNNANEKAWLAGLTYDLSKLVVPGLVTWVDFVWGIDSVDSVKRVPLGHEGECDLVFEYRPRWVQGLALRTRGLLYHQDGTDRLAHIVRFIANWEIPLF
jgi:hypothetical protein